MRANGIKTELLGMVKANKFGLMAHSMRVIGEVTRPMVVADSYTQTVMFMKGNGRTTRHMVSANTITLMAQDMKAIGERTSSMVMGRKLGQTGLAMKVSIKMVRKMASVSLIGRTARRIRDNLLTTIFTEWVFIPGLTAVSTMETG